MTGGRFAGQVALVTGASRGIGLAIAQQFVAESGRVCVTARNADGLADAVAALGGAEHAIAVAGKANDLAHQQDAVQRTLSTFGRIDVLVNNTGVNPVSGPLVDLDLDAARKIMDVNVVAALSWVQQVYRAWMQQNGGAIVNVASVAGLRAAADIGFYGASKAALMHLTQQLATELGPQIRVNAVAPAVVKTKFAAMLYEGKEQSVVERYPLGRLGAPEDIAAAVAFLAGAGASWVTGQVLVVDGGLTLGGGV
ncbi:3-oxoacyl-[acyl-carrier protein] reductase [Frankineae bacterium MT45]|nr:3-oxoacyl-[acyl-carrier protein] reductase [Frankineae bacterium MT45]